MVGKTILDVGPTPTRISKEVDATKTMIERTEERFALKPKKLSDCYSCPGSKTLRTTGTLHSDNAYRYIAHKRDCDSCPLKPQCCPNMPARRVLRDSKEAARDRARALMESEAYGVSVGERKKIETLFGEAKHVLSMVRLRSRGLSGARRAVSWGARSPRRSAGAGVARERGAGVDGDGGLISKARRDRGR